MTAQTHDDPKLVAAAERQMQAWAFDQEMHHQEIQQRSGHLQGPHQKFRGLHPFVAISRQSGACGSEVGRLVGEALGWKVFDKNLLDEIATRFNDSRPMLDLVDETQSNWAFDMLGACLDRQIVPHEKYVRHLSCVVWSAARRQNCVLVGRGAQFILPREMGLMVRITAPEPFRIEQIVLLELEA